MDFLRPEFESAIEPVFEGELVRVGPFTYTGLEIINQTGAGAYRQAFDSWLWDEWIPTRRERKDELLEVSSNKERFNTLKQMIATATAIPFVGSGMSCPTGMPTWSEFLRATGLRSNGLSGDAIDALLAAGQFEAAASRILGAMPEQLFNECFETNFATKPAYRIDGAVRLLPYLFESVAVTTNFDGILEDVYASSSKAFQAVLHGMAVGDFRTKTLLGSRCLLKLHGDYSASHGRVLLEDEYDRFYGHGCNGRRELTHLFQRGGLVFLGCSLAHDRTMALLKEVADADKSMPRHYAFLERPDGSELIRREHFLTERNIFPIWYDGDHNADIEALLVGLMEDLKRL